MSREALGARLPVSSLIDARSNMEKKYGEEERLLRARARARATSGPRSANFRNER